MSFKLDEIIPWGRNLGEYQQMFDLTNQDLASLRILGCADGPASFNAEVTALCGSAISVDPIYQFPATVIESRIRAVRPVVMNQVRSNANDYDWSTMQSPEILESKRLEAMAMFLKDFDAGLKDGRYRACGLPELPFSDGEFDLALCSHALFLYSAEWDSAFHLASIRELMRVSRETRIYPLTTLDGDLSPHLAGVEDWLSEQAFEWQRKPVPYRFQRNATEMLVIRNPGGAKQ